MCGLLRIPFEDGGAITNFMGDTSLCVKIDILSACLHMCHKVSECECMCEDMYECVWVGLGVGRGRKRKKKK